MKPELLMICLLRSSAAALANYRGVGGGGAGVGVAGVAGAGGGAGRGGGPSSSKLPRRMTTTTPRRTSSPSGGSERYAQSSSSSSSSTSPPPPLASSGGGGHIAFRLARRSDVMGIQECNLATLPENYNSNFLVNHVRAWPELSLVAEHVPEGWEEEGEEGGGEDDDYHYQNDDEYGGRSSSTRITPLGEYWKREGLRLQRRRRSDGGDGRPRKEIVGYVLGKVEERPQRREYPPSRVAVPLYDDEETTLLRYLNDGNNPNDGRVRFPSPRGQQQRRHRHPPPPPRERLGHVTSLAVRSHARRLGIASSLLRQLHYHLRECHGADSVGLHVRVSNEAAVRLYCAEGYDVADIMPLYYGDGEDAYFMRKDLLSTVSEDERRSQQLLQGRQWRRGEKERDDWLTRDAARGGSFFEGRKSMRELLSEEERGWVANGDVGNDDHRSSSLTGRGGGGGGNAFVNHPSLLLSGQFQRSFRSFLNGGGERTSPTQRQDRGRFASSRPWETGPDGLRLPRYMTVMRASSLEGGGAPAIEKPPERGGLNLVDLVTDVDDDTSNDDEEGVIESLDSRVATGSV